MVSVYLVTDKGEEIYVYTFPNKETAKNFMTENNTEDLEYVIREVD